MILRDYQQDILDQLLASSTNDIVQLDTGAGKTPIIAALAKQSAHCIVVAHRNTLIKQISEKLAAFGIFHDTISSDYTRRQCALTHRRHGRNYIKRGCRHHIAASIASLVSHHKRGRLTLCHETPWLILIDEAHHVVPDNQWGALKTLFPNARIVGFTATPARMSGESLHVSNGGIFEKLVQARTLGNDSTHHLIEQGYLCDFKAYSTPDHKKLAFEQLMEFPTVEYTRLAKGTQAIMMCQTIMNAYRFAEQFNRSGIPAACINSQQSNTTITRILEKFESREIRVICNVDMIGEGYDFPDVTTLIIAATTGSFIRYRQWIGRVLRPSQGKKEAIIIDLKGMVVRHGMPDEKIQWNLLHPPVQTYERRQIPCPKCGFFYDYRKHEECPECGETNPFLSANALPQFAYQILGEDVVLKERKRISRLQIKKHEEHRYQTQLVYRKFNNDYGVVGKTIKSLRGWFIESLEKGGIEYRDINDFIASDDADSTSFWMSSFTAKDTKASPDKALRVFKEWQQQRA